MKRRTVFFFVLALLLSECSAISLMDAYLRQRQARGHGRHHHDDPFAEYAREEATIVEAPRIHNGINVIYKTENGIEYQFSDAIDTRIAQFFRKLNGE